MINLKSLPDILFEPILTSITEIIFSIDYGLTLADTQKRPFSRLDLELLPRTIHLALVRYFSHLYAV